jgi:hypothetical protein
MINKFVVALQRAKEENNLIIFVPQGAEYQAVCRGLGKTINPPQVIPIPIGVKPVTKYLQNYDLTGKRVLLMGLGGSLSPQLKIGDVVIYENCLYVDNKSQLITKQCDSNLVDILSQLLPRAKKVHGITCDRFIHLGNEKQELGQKYNVSVVDMEGFAILNQCQSVAIIRVISDDCHHDLPDLNNAINPQGKLDNLKMTLAFLRQPLASLKLIKGSLNALKILEKISAIIAK